MEERRQEEDLRTRMGAHGPKLTQSSCIIGGAPSLHSKGVDFLKQKAKVWISLFF